MPCCMKTVRPVLFLPIKASQLFSFKPYYNNRYRLNSEKENYFLNAMLFLWRQTKKVEVIPTNGNPSDD